MKKISLLLVGLAMVAGMAIAQDQNTGLNSTFTYQTSASVTGSSFTWSILDHSTSLPVAAGASTYSTTSTIGAGGVNNIVIKWLGNGNYDIVVREVTTNNCSDASTDKTIWVNVASSTNAINLATYTNTPDCWSAASSNLPFSFDYAPSAANYPIVITYSAKVNGAATATTGLTYTLTNSSTALQIGIANFLNNATTSSATNTVEITSVSTANGDVISLGTTTILVSQTVHAKPVTNAITY